MMDAANTELVAKLERARSLLEQYQADGLLLRRVSSFAWATCGASSYVNTATTEGAASLLITRDHCYLATNNIEAERLEQETVLPAQGWKFHVSPWADPQAALTSLVKGQKLIADVAYPGAVEIGGVISRLRARLSAPEVDRFRHLAALCASAMDAAARAIRPGMSEYELAAVLGAESQRRGVQPIVNLIATDERIFRFRHPLPTENRLERYALLVLSGRRWGLVCSISRLVHFGRIPAALEARIHAAMQVNATLVAATRPSAVLGEILAAGQAAYAAAGFADEWQKHHQGGVVGYEPREYLATPGSSDQICSGQALAWNPSIAGAKVEDTILVGPQHAEILTVIPGWPVEVVSAPGHDSGVLCPCALEIP